jgi:LytTr DNA-binding domain
MGESPPIHTPDGAASRRAWRTVLAGDWPRTLVVVVLVGGVLALAGAFGTGELSLVPRFAYWLALVLVGAFLGRYGGRRLVPRPWWETRPILVVGLMTLLIGLPMTVVAAIGNNWIRHGQLGLRYSWDVLPSTLATTAVLVVLVFLVQSRAAVATHEAPRGAPPPRFLTRLPAKLAGADLWAIEAEDHYLRLHTSRGDDLILMRLADALVELEGIEGARTHRSWWVARDAVVAAERAEGRATLTLAGGIKAPVSRAYVKPLREAGWF